MVTLTVSVKEEALEKEINFEKRCRHYWVIESPSGAMSKGMCKICGMVREFRNYVSDFPWEDDGKEVGFSNLAKDLSKELVFEP